MKKNIYRRAAASVLAAALCCGAVAPRISLPETSLTASAVSSLSRYVIDINKNDGRKASLSKTANNWVFTGSDYSLSGMTFKLSMGSSVGESVDVVNNKKLQFYDGTTPHLTMDGAKIKGGDNGGVLKLEISGLSNGTHSFSGWHACVDNVQNSTLSLSVNGTKVQTGIPCPTNPRTSDEAGRSYAEFSGTSVTITIQGEGGGAVNNAWLNAFEIDGASPFASISKISPADGVSHHDAENGLNWTAGNGATQHEVYIGTDPAAVFSADKSSPEYKGTVTKPHFDLDDSYSSLPTYYWRVDEVSANGTVKGSVYSFKLNRLAFPSAEGYGRFARGGRGGRIVEVTNLNDSGEGSLRQALEVEKDARIVVFRVGGVIALKSTLCIPEDGGDVYVAGQTAPGDGITLINYDFGAMGSEDVVIRDVRVRVGDMNGSSHGGMGLSSCNNTIIDHCSISWATDEGFSSRSASAITFQWNIIGESLNNSVHYDANDRSNVERHAFAASISGNIGSFHHNLLINNTGRNFSLAGGMENDGVTYGGALDISNNVVYNWRDRTTDGGVRRLNFVNNYYKGGAVSNTGLHVVSLDGNELNTSDMQKMYVSGNIMTDSSGNQLLKASDDAWAKGKAVSGGKNSTASDVRSNSAFFPNYITLESAEAAYQSVINNSTGAGANVPKLDYIDSRYHKEVTSGTYTYTGSKDGLKGIIDSQNDVGGYPNSTNFKGGNAPTDTDHDGMPDEWENAHGLDPNNASDGSIVSLSPDDYTNVELYLNELAGDTVVIEDSPARSAFDTFEAEDYDIESGTRNQEGEGETHVAYIESGDFIAFKNLDFENGAKSFTANITGNPSGINIYIDSITGEPAASLTFNGSNGWNDWQSISANIPDITGKHTVYLQFTGGEGYLMNIDSFSFGRDYVPLNGKLMTGITAAADAGAPYWKPAFNAAVGSPIFGDRAFTIASLPDTLSGAEQLLTSCGAKAFTGDAAQFTAAEDITLFVALDSRMPEVPEWLGSYTKTGESVTSSNDVTFELYALNVDKGSEVTLGGNGYSYNVVSYIVFAAERVPETTTTTEVTTTTTETTTTTTVTASTRKLYLGDADLSESISIADVVTVLQYAANHDKYSLEPDALANADVDGDGDVTVNDAFIIQQVDAGLVLREDLPIARS